MDVANDDDRFFLYGRSNAHEISYGWEKDAHGFCGRQEWVKDLKRQVDGDDW